MYISLDNYRGDTVKYLGHVEHAIFHMKKELARWWLFTHTVAVRSIEIETHSMSANSPVSNKSDIALHKTYSYILHDENDDFVGKLVSDYEITKIAGGDILQVNFSVFDVDDLSGLQFVELKKNLLFGVYSVKNLKTGDFVFCDGDKFANHQLEFSPGVGSYLFACLAMSVLFFVIATVVSFYLLESVSVLQAEMIGALGSCIAFFVVPWQKNWKPSFSELGEKIGKMFEGADSKFETKMSIMVKDLKARAMRAMEDGV